MMTIDEAIKHAKEVAKEKYKEGFLYHANPDDEQLDQFIRCGREHEQLAEWLEELKKLHKERNSIIDNFVHKISLHYLGVHPDEFRGYYPQEIVSTIGDIAKTMKNERKKLDRKISESEEVFYKESDIIKIVDKHTNESGELDDDISCILEEIPNYDVQNCNITSKEKKRYIDSTEFQTKVLNYIGSEDFNKMVNSTIFKDN